MRNSHGFSRLACSGKQVEVWLKIVASISIEKLCLLNLIMTLMG